MTLNYNHLYYFHLAAVEGTVAAAAQRLGVTPATVSEQLRSLERALGHKLFVRTQSGLKLTEAGRVTFEHSTPMFRLGERLVDTLNTSTRAPHMLRIGMSGPTAYSTTANLLIPILAREECMPTLRAGATAELLRELRQGMLDVVLCECEPPELMSHGLAVTMIDRTQFVAIGPPAIEPSADWKCVRFVHYRPVSPYRQEVSKFLDSRGLEPAIVGEADDPFILVEAVARGGCVAIVPQIVARDAIAAGRVKVLMDVEAAACAIYALHQKNVAADTAVEMIAVAVRGERP